MQVNIYIDILHRGNLKTGTGTYCIVLEYIKTDGTPATKEIFKGINKTTKNRTALIACIVALSSLVKNCYVDLYINNTYVTETMINEWYYNWNLENWTSKQKPVKNADLWKQLFDVLERHEVKFILKDVNPYTGYMETMLRRIEIEYKEDEKNV